MTWPGSATTARTNASSAFSPKRVRNWMALATSASETGAAEGLDGLEGLAAFDAGAADGDDAGAGLPDAVVGADDAVDDVQPATIATSTTRAPSARRGRCRTPLSRYLIVPPICRAARPPLRPRVGTRRLPGEKGSACASPASPPPPPNPPALWS